ncbi:SDR family NAD(P)-dependent oxidoreductase [Phytohabitans rumicis]|uniref:3-oxoacyl-ACP reductase n=1 Tax=Phytohabitans rumicis TaxID=1076125 RepID=A0A6V8KV27_9ACTN|nr:SDR family oxidoreductase [Phytohabitans rumicis]GFJ87300.1 3-oxoacyl-ACP reductase [Phytohabitans rumicis]
MSGDFTGKVALVTGGGTGIGAATVALLRTLGAEVVVLGPDGADLAGTAATTGAVAVAGDASDGADCAAAVATARERWGRLDTLVGCAGIGTFGTVLDTGEDEWHRVLRANVDTAYVAARACLPELIRTAGTIVLVSSLAGRVAVPGSAAYVTAKHAIIGLVRSLAADFGPHGVRANAVCPAMVRTRMSDAVMDTLGRAAGLDRAQAYERAAALYPLRRAAEPAQIAEVIAFLAGPRSAAVTGAVLMADGGVSAVDLSLAALTVNGDRNEPAGQ